MTTPATLAPLPHWETIPDDMPAAIVEVKRALRERIAASGRSVAEVFAEVEARIRAEVADISGDPGPRRAGLAGARLRRHRGRHRRARAGREAAAGGAAR